jgi:predicted transcriptional regulator
MAQTVMVGTRVSAAFRDQVDEIAHALRRDRAWVIEEALKRYVDEQAAFIAAVRQGQEDARAGRVTDHDAFMSELDEMIDTIEAEQRHAPHMD